MIDREYTVVRDLAAFDEEVKLSIYANAVENRAHLFDVKTDSPEDMVCLGLVRGNFLLGIGRNMNFEAAKFSAVIKEGAANMAEYVEIDQAKVSDFVLRTFLEQSRGDDSKKTELWGKIDEVATWMMQATGRDLDNFMSSKDF